MKKIILSLIMAAIILTVMPLTSYAAQIYERPLYGDANHNGDVNMEDVTHIQKHIAELEIGIFCRSCADVYDVGVDMLDVTLLQKHLAKLKTESRCGDEAREYSGLTSIKIDDTLKTAIGNAYTEHNPLSEEKLNELKADYGETVDVNYYGTLCDGTMMVIAQYNGYSFSSSIEEIEINGYIYTHTNGGNEMHLYKDGKYVSMEEALEKKMITEDVFKELVFHLHMKYK